MAKNEVQVKEESNVVAFDPSILLEDAGTASENMTADDMLIPRLKLLLLVIVKHTSSGLMIVSWSQTMGCNLLT